MTNPIRKIILLTVLLIGLFWFHPARAIDYGCKGADQYKADLKLTPASGDYPTEVTLTSTFQWLTSRQACLGNTLQFYLSYQTLGSKQILGDIDKVKFKNLGISGALRTGQTVTSTYRIKIKDLVTPISGQTDIDKYVYYGEAIKFRMKLESDDLTDYGQDLTDYYVQTFTLAPTEKTCAYQDVNGRLRCLPGTANLAKNNQCSQATGRDTHDQPVDCIQQKCQPVEASQCVGPASGPIDFGPNTPGQPQKWEFKLTNPLKGDINSIGGLIKLLSDFLLELAIPLAVIIILWGGFLMLTSGGNPGRYQKGIEAVKWAAIGFAVVTIGAGFVALVKSLLSVTK